MSEFNVPDGRAIHYRVRGEAGPALVLLNGMSQSTANWMSQVRHFDAEGFRVVMYDARGQGRSDLGEGRITIDGHVSDLEHLLDHLAIESCIACGFSHGARLALAFAARRPDRVDELVLTSIGDGDDPLRRTIVRSWVEVLRRGGLEAMAWCSIPDILGRAFLADNEGTLEAMVRATLQRNTPEGMSALLEAADAYPPALDDAPGVRCPTLLLTSPDDLLVSPESAWRLADAIPDCRHAVVEGCGHTIPIERPVAWRERVLTFVG